MPLLKDLITRNRSYRRFHKDQTIAQQTLHDLVELARLSGSAANLQPLKFVTSCDADKNAHIFESLVWAGYLKDWPGPDEGERPGGYIVILGDTEISKSFGVDHGIAAQSIMLGAVELGLGGCMIGSIKRDDLRVILGISEQYEILLVLAIGKPKERVVVENLDEDRSIKYYRDSSEVHHVPKRLLAELIVMEF